MRLTKEQRALAVFFVGLVPAGFGVAIPGGLAHEQPVDLSFGAILLATVPWTGSVALIAYFVLRWGDTREVVLGSLAVLVGGAFLAPSIGPQFEVQAAKADSVAYAFFSANPAATRNVTVAAEHNPKITATVLAFGVAIFIVAVYGLMYGFALWFAGIVAGDRKSVV